MDWFLAGSKDGLMLSLSLAVATIPSMPCRLLILPITSLTMFDTLKLNQFDITASCKWTRCCICSTWLNNSSQMPWHFQWESSCICCQYRRQEGHWATCTCTLRLTLGMFSEWGPIFCLKVASLSCILGPTRQRCHSSYRLVACTTTKLEPRVLGCRGGRPVVEGRGSSHCHCLQTTWSCLSFHSPCCIWRHRKLAQYLAGKWLVCGIWSIIASKNCFIQFLKLHF